MEHCSHVDAESGFGGLAVWLFACLARRWVNKVEDMEMWVEGQIEAEVCALMIYLFF